MTALDTLSPAKMLLNTLGITKPAKGSPPSGLVGTLLQKG